MSIAVAILSAKTMRAAVDASYGMADIYERDVFFPKALMRF
jgi:hypothetical protein